MEQKKKIINVLTTYVAADQIAVAHIDDDGNIVIITINDNKIWLYKRDFEGVDFYDAYNKFIEDWRNAVE